MQRLFPDTLASTWYLHYYGLTKIPLLFYVRPSVIEQSNERVVIKIPLGRRTRNHHGSMYFAALAIGADCCVGLLAVAKINKRPEKISFIFREFHADFYRRANANVHFSCNQGREIAGLVDQAANQEERVELPIDAVATVPNESDQPIARFRLLLSLKRSM